MNDQEELDDQDDQEAEQRDDQLETAAGTGLAPVLARPPSPSCRGQPFRFSLKKAMVRDQASLAAASSYRGVVSL